MADSFLQTYTPAGSLTPDKQMDAETVDFSGTTRYRERNQVAGALAGEVARVMSTTPAGSEMGLVVRVVGATTSTTITNVVPGVTGTALGKAIAATVGATDTGVGAWAQRRDALVTLTPADGQYTPMFLSSRGALWTVNDEMEQVFGSVAHDSPDLHPPVKGGLKATAALVSAVTEGDVANLSGDLFGRLRVIGSLANGALGVSERAAGGTSPITQVTVNDSTANGVALIAANTTTRRRVVVTNTTTSVVWINTGNLTAGGIGLGEPLAGVIGAEKSFVVTSALRATVAAGTAIVSVREEVLA